MSEIYIVAVNVDNETQFMSVERLLMIFHIKLTSINHV